MHTFNMVYNDGAENGGDTWRVTIGNKIRIEAKRWNDTEEEYEFEVVDEFANNFTALPTFAAEYSSLAAGVIRQLLHETGQK